jgi:uracil phosphoribosyltransferase
VVAVVAVTKATLDTRPNLAEEAEEQEAVQGLEIQEVVHYLAVAEEAEVDTPQAVRLARQAVCGVPIPRAAVGPLEVAVLEATAETTPLGVVTAGAEALVQEGLVLMEVQAECLAAAAAVVAAEAIRQEARVVLEFVGFGRIR